MTTADNRPTFAPQLFIPSRVKDMSFYLNSFGAKETMKFKNQFKTIFPIPCALPTFIIPNSMKITVSVL